MPDAPSKLMVVLSEIATERERQDKKWGQQNHPNGTSEKRYKVDAEMAKEVCDRLARLKELTWLSILKEEVYEAFAEEDPQKLRVELIQVAAVAEAWVEAIDRAAQK